MHKGLGGVDQALPHSRFASITDKNEKCVVGGIEAAFDDYARKAAEQSQQPRDGKLMSDFSTPLYWEYDRRARSVRRAVFGSRRPSHALAASGLNDLLLPTGAP